MSQSNIRNFCVIAHIDHGKSTLADRLLEMTGTIKKRDMQEQVLDSNPIERERGITIKLAPVRMLYKIPTQSLRFGVCDLEFSNSEYILNLIDTPGHVDFGYEVSRSLAACEGALLVVDATQGVQAQTLANLEQARKNNLTIIPLINKIDMPMARISETRQELKELGFRDEEILEISAKTGENVDQVLKAIVERIPSPKGDPNSATRALIFSSQYDQHKGVIVFVRVVDGSIPTFKGQTLQGIKFLASGAEVQPIEIGYFSPQMIPCPPAGGLRCGEVGYIATGLKDVKMAKIGDTITMENGEWKMENGNKTKSNFNNPRHSQFSILNSQFIQPLAGYKEPKPMVFVGLFPISQDELVKAREAMEKLQLSDSAFTFKPISSLALGNGFHCGFLGLLHAEIVQERLQREFGLSMLATSPSVEYRLQYKTAVRLKNSDDSGFEDRKPASPAGGLKAKSLYSIQSASEFPDPSQIEQVFEPVMEVTIFSPKDYIGAIMQLSEGKRGTFIDLKYRGETAQFTYLIPLSDMIVDFFDRLKSVTQGYASLDYQFFDYQPVDVVKVDILVAKEPVDALSFLINKDAAQRRGREIVERLVDVIPRQQFVIPIQAAIGGTVIARADVKPFRKDVIQKLYGGDRTRKDKLLEAQKKGKARMKQIGRVEIPQDAFFNVLKKR